jgi:hypothetical protein
MHGPFRWGAGIIALPRQNGVALLRCFLAFKVFQMRYLPALLLMLLSSPVFASLQLVSPTASTNILDINDFKGVLSSDWSLEKILTAIDVKVVGDGFLQFFVHGSESGFVNTFTAGAATFTEPTVPSPADVPWNGPGTAFGPLIAVSDGNLLGATLGAKFTTTGSGGQPALLGGTSPDVGFGIFLKADGSHDPNRLFFGYDDNGAGPDDNHDDLIISVLFTSLSGAPPELPEPISCVVWGCLGWIAFFVTGRRERV